jgi:LPXTG-motif cell wall-anchored protein
MLCSLVLLVLIGISPVEATVLPALSPFVSPALGQSDLESDNTAGDFVDIDWVVETLTAAQATALGVGAAGDIVYAYQIENTTAGGGSILAFSVTFDTSKFPVIGAGIISGDDLDAGLVLSPHALGAGDDNDALGVSTTSGTASVNPMTVGWSFTGGTPVPTGKESDTLFFVTQFAPRYGNGNAQDGSPPSPWSSLSIHGSDKLPVPTPEPGSVAAIAGIALFGLIGWFWRRRK